MAVDPANCDRSTADRTDRQTDRHICIQKLPEFKGMLKLEDHWRTDRRTQCKNIISFLQHYKSLHKNYSANEHIHKAFLQ